MSKPKLALIPSGYKSGKVYSILPNDATGDFDFTRQSIGTRVRKDGLIEEAKTSGSITNVLLYSEDYSQVNWAKTSVTVTTNQFLAPDGTNSADKLDFSSSTSARMAQVINAPAGNYTFSVYLRSVSGSGDFRIRLQSGGGINLTVSLTEQWQRFDLEYYHSGGASLIPYIGYYIDASYIQEVYSWGAMVNEGALSDYIKTEGTTETKTVETFTDVPRLDWLNSNCPSLLLEPQRSNNLKYSEDFSNAVWGLLSAGTGVNPIVTANYSIAPNGTLTADRIIFNQGSGTSGSDYSIIRQVVTSVGQGISSVYMKSNTNDDYVIGIDEVGLGTKDVTVTPDWQRFEYSETTNDRLQLSLRGGTNSNYADISVWGAMLEQGDYPTSYIKTEASLVTRLKDECINGGDSDLFDITEGTFFVDVTPYKSDSSFTAISLNDDSANNRVEMFFYGGTNQVRFVLAGGGSGLSLDNYETITYNTRNKMAVTFNGSIAKVYLNGSLEHTDPSVDAMVGLDRLEFTLFNGTVNFEGKVHDTRVYDRVLTEAEAIELTTL